MDDSSEKVTMERSSSMAHSIENVGESSEERDMINQSIENNKEEDSMDQGNNNINNNNNNNELKEYKKSDDMVIDNDPISHDIESERKTPNRWEVLSGLSDSSTLSFSPEAPDVLNMSSSLHISHVATRLSHPSNEQASPHSVNTSFSHHSPNSPNSPNSPHSANKSPSPHSPNSSTSQQKTPHNNASQHSSDSSDSSDSSPSSRSSNSTHSFSATERDEWSDNEEPADGECPVSSEEGYGLYFENQIADTFETQHKGLFKLSLAENDSESFQNNNRTLQAKKKEKDNTSINTNKNDDGDDNSDSNNNNNNNVTHPSLPSKEDTTAASIRTTHNKRYKKNKVHSMDKEPSNWGVESKNEEHSEERNNEETLGADEDNDSNNVSSNTNDFVEDEYVEVNNSDNSSNSDEDNLKEDHSSLNWNGSDGKRANSSHAATNVENDKNNKDKIIKKLRREVKHLLAKCALETKHLQEIQQDHFQLEQIYKQKYYADIDKNNKKIAHVLQKNKQLIDEVNHYKFYLQEVENKIQYFLKNAKLLIHMKRSIIHEDIQNNVSIENEWTEIMSCFTEDLLLLLANAKSSSPLELETPSINITSTYLQHSITTPTLTSETTKQADSITPRFLQSDVEQQEELTSEEIRGSPTKELRQIEENPISSCMENAKRERGSDKEKEMEREDELKEKSEKGLAKEQAETVKQNVEEKEKLTTKGKKTGKKRSKGKRHEHEKEIGSCKIQKDIKQINSRTLHQLTWKKPRGSANESDLTKGYNSMFHANLSTAKKKALGELYPRSNIILKRNSNRRNSTISRLTKNDEMEPNNATKARKLDGCTRDKNALGMLKQKKSSKSNLTKMAQTGDIGEEETNTILKNKRTLVRNTKQRCNTLENMHPNRTQLQNAAFDDHKITKMFNKTRKIKYMLQTCLNEVNHPKRKPTTKQNIIDKNNLSKESIEGSSDVQTTTKKLNNSNDNNYNNNSHRRTQTEGNHEQRQRNMKRSMTQKGSKDSIYLRDSKKELVKHKKKACDRAHQKRQELSVLLTQQQDTQHKNYQKWYEYECQNPCSEQPGSMRDAWIVTSTGEKHRPVTREEMDEMQKKARYAELVESRAERNISNYCYYNCAEEVFRYPSPQLNYCLSPQLNYCPSPQLNYCPSPQLNYYPPQRVVEVALSSVTNGGCFISTTMLNSR